MLADEGAAAETPNKKRRAVETTPASAGPVNGRAAASDVVVVVAPGRGTSKGQPAEQHPLAHAVPAAAPKGRVFAINGFQAATTTKPAHGSSPTAPARAGPDTVRLVPPAGSMRLVPAAALESTYVRMRLDALLSSI